MYFFYSTQIDNCASNSTDISNITSIWNIGVLILMPWATRSLRIPSHVWRDGWPLCRDSWCSLYNEREVAGFHWASYGVAWDGIVWLADVIYEIYKRYRMHHAGLWCNYNMWSLRELAPDLWGYQKYVTYKVPLVDTMSRELRDIFIRKW